MTNTSAPHRVAIFEDDDIAYEALASALKVTADEVGAELSRYPGERPWDQGKGSGQLPKLVEEHLLRPRAASLVVLDWDLSRYEHPVTSELVRGICDDVALPVCTYRTERGEVGRVKRLQRWQDREIAIDSSMPPERVAAMCGWCLRGFVAIDQAFGSGRPLAGAVKSLLRPPTSAEVQLDQYAWGSPEALQVAERPDHQDRFAATTLGYWIYNRLLQFPGVLLNGIAAASYLDIDPKSLERTDVRDFFTPALYQGPFADTGPYWWTSGLDDVCAAYSLPEDGTLVTGRTALARAGIEVPRVKCSRGHDGAGYYCIITRQPVCAEHSEQPTGWLPIGADRSRIESGRFQELGAWLAL
jgi:hypothetical protein